MPFLEPSALLVWLVPALGIYSWADVAAEEAAAYRVYLFVFFIIFHSLPWPPLLKKKNPTKPTQPTSGELSSLWLSFSLLFRSLPTHPPHSASQAGVQHRAGDSLWNYFVEHVAMRSLISTASRIEIGVCLGWVSEWPIETLWMWCFPLPWSDVLVLSPPLRTGQWSACMHVDLCNPPFSERFHVSSPAQKTNLWIAWVFLKSCTKMSH